MSEPIKKMKVGIIGTGNISWAYFEGLKLYPFIEVAACADMNMDSAKEKAAKYNIPKVCSVDELLADSSIEIVINLTIPKAHAPVNLRILEAGKHAYCEKPFALNREEGRTVLELAKKKGLRVGCAPDTFLGPGQQLARKLLDDGWIGRAIGGTAHMICHGHESWHPSPEFYYEVGGGPLFDMGPYYINALINLLGPVKRVTSSAQTSFATRTITSEPKKGKVVKVETPTHIASIMDFHNGAVVTLLTSFDVWAGNLPNIEIFGTEGSMSVPDPNGTGGTVKVIRPGMPEWLAMPPLHAEPGCRGIGVADMAMAIWNNRPQRMTGELGFHALDIMQSILDASATGKHIILESACERPKALPPGMAQGQVDA
ncbi:Gfo/Idh/MocA family oxidoreductase [Kamptonema cortianum]|nr:Gfo/Idh/MocA family oxidoreductase [Oscillatoria laete-virens]MDK3159485.1 Gfo/Idh/MocA family oxidoreductase [Kamptonema cortianum]MDL5044559.1 Gfo/Idh/MocA family oxidoreductase [Oscillatoria amoena NRMC-F 0135]MDL5053025.1 Gfo/Idh/MocA family oxidoreductase [Oscillatoria laete-virens NRMC-F 0139]